MKTMTPPRELMALRRKAEGKLVVLSLGPYGDPLGIFTTLDGALWAMRHYGPYREERWWRVQLFDTDIIDKKGSHNHMIHDNIVRWIFGEKVAPQ